MSPSNSYKALPRWNRPPLRNYSNRHKHSPILWSPNWSLSEDLYSQTCCHWHQKVYIQRVKKNNKLSVPHFLGHLKQINLLVAQFPNLSLQHCFTDNEIKRLFYFAMPIHWHTNFINSKQSLHTSTMEGLESTWFIKRTKWILTEKRWETEIKPSSTIIIMIIGIITVLAINVHLPIRQIFSIQF